MIVSLSVLIPAIGISIGATWIMSIYGFHNDNGVQILRILSLASVISASTSVIGSVISSMGNMWHGFIINSLWAAVFILSFLNLKRDSLGLAEAYLVSYLVHLIVVSGYSFFFLRKKLILTNSPRIVG